ncbi:MAG: DUF5518 domain-containing protein [Acidobacteriota bacterium]
MDSARLQPALYGGIVIGVLSALPIVSAGNCCCCLWVIAGGMLAAYLRQQNSSFSISSSEGALVGLLAGLIGGVIGVVLSIPMEAMIGPFQRQLVERVLSSQPDIPAETRQMLERASTGPAVIAVKFVWGVVTGAIFGMLGGLLGVAVFKKSAPPPPGTIQVLPPEV